MKDFNSKKIYEYSIILIKVIVNMVCTVYGNSW